MSVRGDRLLELRPYRSYWELLKEPEDMTEDERRRLVKIKAIPKEDVTACEYRICQLRDYVMKAEAEADRLIDFLNGEDVPREGHGCPHQNREGGSGVKDSGAAQPKDVK